MSFLKRRISAAVWEVMLLLVLVIVFSTVYRIYFSRAEALTQVCTRLQDIQTDDNADMFNSLAGEVGQWLQEVNQICEVRRPVKEKH